VVLHISGDVGGVFCVVDVCDVFMLLVFMVFYVGFDGVICWWWSCR